MASEDTLAYYTESGPFSSAGAHGTVLRALPGDVAGLVDAVQGLLIHKDLTWAYDVSRTDEHEATSNYRSVERFLDRLLGDGCPITERRQPAERLGGTCRDFTTVTVAALRAHGIPARARCGFGAYFPGDTMEDHWVAEYWRAEQARWVLVDAQIDDHQREIFGTDLDFTDVPRDQFVVAGLAWQRCRSGNDDANRYGLTSIKEFGDWWIAGNLIRDVAALSNLELLPWDVWGVMPEPEGEITEELAALFDKLAAITADPETAADSRAIYQSDDRLRVPAEVHNVARGRKERIVPV